MKIAFVFPGQGSQSVGMLDSFRDNAAVQSIVARASSALGQNIGALIEAGPAEELNLTINTQPALLTAGYAIYAAWRAAGGAEPAIVAGHSLGEYTALVAAGALELEDAVRLVRFRAQAMQDAVPVGVGSMAAILGLLDEQVQQACSEAAQGEIVEAVNFNAPSQVVIAGHSAAVQRACEVAKRLGAKRAVPLSVSAPFHSSLLQPASERLRERLSQRDAEKCAHRVDQQRRCIDRIGAGKNCGCSRATGGQPGTMVRHHSQNERAWCDARGRMWPRTRAVGFDKANRPRASRASSSMTPRRLRLRLAALSRMNVFTPDCLRGEVALVTGASRGIGQAIADHLARAGAIVIGTATSQSGADQISQRLAGLSSGSWGITRCKRCRGRRRADRRDRQGAWEAFDSRKQRRHHARHSGDAHEGR